MVVALLGIVVATGGHQASAAKVISKACVSRTGLVLTVPVSKRCRGTESRLVLPVPTSDTLCIAANRTLRLVRGSTCPARTTPALLRAPKGTLPACVRSRTRTVHWRAAKRCPKGFVAASIALPSPVAPPTTATTVPATDPTAPPTTQDSVTSATVPATTTVPPTTIPPSTVPATTTVPPTTTTIPPTTTTTTTVPPSVISSFEAGATTINQGDSTTLRATYTGANATIDQMVGSVASGNAVAISPLQTTTYKLTVDNGAGHSVSQFVTVHVNSLSITSQPQDTVSVLDSGDYLRVTATATGGLSYQWHRGGSEIAGAVGSSYRATQDGTYHVVVTSNLNGVTRSVTSSSVSFAMNTVSVTSHPSDAVVAEGDTNTFSVSVTASGTVTYQWYVNDSPVDGAVGRTFAGSTLGTHKVRVTSTVNGVARSVDSNSAWLDVNKVNITSQPSDAYVTTGGTTMLSVGVSVQGGTTIGYQWHKDGNPVDGAVSQTFDAGSGGAYKVLVTSTRGGTTSSKFSSTATVTEVAPATITTFEPAASSVALGGSTTFTPVFTGSSGTITPGNISVASGDTVTVSPSRTTVYTLTVSNAAGTSTAATYRITVTTGTVAATANNSSVDRYALSTAVKMTDGRVVVFGNFLDFTRVTDVFDPTTDSFTRVGDMVQGRGGAPGILLPDGKVLAIGGTYHTGTAYASRQSSELFDPATDTWTASGNLVTSRRGHFAVLLANGKVLVGGGVTGTNTYLASVEMYDPATGTFTAKASMPAARGDTNAALLPNGNVMVMGGYNPTNGHMKTAVIYDVASNSWSSVTSQMISPHSAGTAVVVLADGRIVIGGGWNGGSGVSAIELYDPVAGTFAQVLPVFSFGRGNVTAHQMPSGLVAFFGGSSGAGNIADSIVLFDPTTRTLTTEVNTMRWWRYQHSSALLDDGRVVVIGGNSPNKTSADLYTE